MTSRHEFEKHAVDLEQMSDTLGAAAKRPDRIPVGFMTLMLDYVKTHLRLPIAQVEGGYGVVQDEGTPLTMRKKINVVGSGATATDDATNNVTLITIPGGGAPSGAAGGDLSGTYPNPSVAALAITDAKVATANKDGLAATASMRTLGTGAAQAAAGNDSRLSDSRAPSGSAGGDLTGTYPNPTVAALAITDAKVAAANKDGIAATASLRTLGTGAQQAAAGNDSRLSDSRAPSGTAGGDLTGTYPNPTLGTAGPGATGPIGDSTHTPVVTIDAKGRVTALTSVAIASGAAADISARVFSSANQSLNNNTFTKLTFDSERFDTNTIHDNVTNNTRLTCNTAGKYQISANVSFAANASGWRGILITLNAGLTSIAELLVPAAPTVAGSTPQTLLSTSTLYSLAVGDYVELFAIQTSGAALNVIVNANVTNEFMMVLL